MQGLGIQRGLTLDERLLEIIVSAIILSSDFNLLIYKRSMQLYETIFGKKM
jgi:hypothetical protein